MPASKIRIASPHRISTQDVLPPISTVPGPGTGMLPRTPQKRTRKSDGSALFVRAWSPPFELADFAARDAFGCTGSGRAFGWVGGADTCGAFGAEAAFFRGANERKHKETRRGPSTNARAGAGLGGRAMHRPWSCAPKGARIGRTWP